MMTIIMIYVEAGKEDLFEELNYGFEDIEEFIYMAIIDRET